MTHDTRLMTDVVVIGGGFAGLQAAVALTDAGRQVTVLEARPVLGGRARSFKDPATGEVVDNGQHLFIGAYHATIAFLERLGTAGHLQFQNRLEVTFIEPGGRLQRLRCPRFPAPWHFVAGLAGFPGLSRADKWSLWKLVFGGVLNAQTDSETAAQWLTRLGQSEQARRRFWDPLILATLNEDPRTVSALGLKAVLRRLLREPWPSARLGMSRVGLTDLYAPAAVRLIEAGGGRVLPNSPVQQLRIDNGQIRSVRLVNGTQIEAEAVIAAVGPAVLAKLLGGDPALQPLADQCRIFRSAPILSVNLWLDRPVIDALFVGMTGTRMQWLFNKPALLGGADLPAGYLSLIVSAAHRWIDTPNEHLVRMALEDLQACFPRAREAVVVRSQVVREREATVSLGVGIEQVRPGPVTAVPNLFLAGDWTNTGLPATIESAVLSGIGAARALVPLRS